MKQEGRTCPDVPESWLHVVQGPAPGGALDALRNNPQFQTLRQLVQAQPGILEPMLQVCVPCIMMAFLVRSSGSVYPWDNSRSNLVHRQGYLSCTSIVSVQVIISGQQPWTVLYCL